MQDHPPGRRRALAGALECMLWAGTGLLWTVTGGIPRAGLRTSPPSGSVWVTRKVVHCSASSPGLTGESSMEPVTFAPALSR